MLNWEKYGQTRKQNGKKNEETNYCPIPIISPINKFKKSFIKNSLFIFGEELHFNTKPIRI